MGGLKLPDICLTGEEKLRKNLSQETCPDRRSNPSPLCDRHACYSGGLVLELKHKNSILDRGLNPGLQLYEVVFQQLSYPWQVPIHDRIDLLQLCFLDRYRP